MFSSYLPIHIPEFSYHHVTFFYLQILFNIPLLTYETMYEYIGSTGAKDR